jgi:hypothetical protein
VPDFEQLLNQYHGAHMPAYAQADNRMSTVFFGGIGRYYFDANDQLIDDVNVPFVNTISRVAREADGSMEEVAIGEMPALLGAGAEFLHEPATPMISDAIVDLDALVGDTVVVGHIVGGIQSTARNIFFINNGTQSDASTRVFRVLLVRDATTGSQDPLTEGREALQLSVVPGSGELFITIDLPVAAQAEVLLLDSSGRQVRQLFAARMIAGSQRMQADVRDLAPGAYLVELRAGELRRTVRFVR